jgi:hypothetical protein
MMVVEIKIWSAAPGLPQKLLTRHVFNALCEMTVAYEAHHAIVDNHGERLMGFTFKPLIDSFLIQNRARDPGYEEG